MSTLIDFNSKKYYLPNASQDYSVGQRLTGADLTGADLTGVILLGANLINATLTNVKSCNIEGKLAACELAHEITKKDFILADKFLIELNKIIFRK
jgi:uncharacterized protein YjbI with pentapeptide repeats